MFSTFTGPSACLNSSEELDWRTAIYGSLADIIFSLIIHCLAPEDEHADLLIEEIKITAQASMPSITAFIGLASNLQLVRWHVVLDHLLLMQPMVTRLLGDCRVSCMIGNGVQLV